MIELLVPITTGLEVKRKAEYAAWRGVGKGSVHLPSCVTSPQSSQNTRGCLYQYKRINLPRIFISEKLTVPYPLKLYNHVIFVSSPLPFVEYSEFKFV